MSDKIVLVEAEKIKNFIFDVFINVGVPKEDAKICTDVLISSDLSGIDSHGIGRLKMYYDRIKEGIQEAVTKIEIVKETETTALIDGNHGMGHVVAYKSMKMAMEKAKEYGLGAIAVRNSTHFGIAGYYPEMATKEGMIGMTVTNARPSIAPTFGVEAMLGTNPLTFGAPTDEEFTFLIDCATSISQRGKIEVLGRAELPTPEGWAIDSEGEPYTETKALLKDMEKGKAALLPLGGATEKFGGHKGYGWATMVEIFSAALQDGAHLRDLLGYDEEGNRTHYKVGHFFLAIDIEHFLPLNTFKRVAGNIVRGLRNSQKVPGKDRIYTAGEKEYEMRKIRLKEGIPINGNLQKNLKIIQDELKLYDHNLPF